VSTMAGAELVFERSFYIGVVMASIVYGAQVTMFLQSLYYVAQDPRRTREQIIYVAYGGLVLLAVTIVIATKSFEGQQMWIENPNYPGGPEAYLAAHAASWIATLNGAAVVFTDVLVNLLLLYRCFIIWDSVVLISLLPTLVFLAATGSRLFAPLPVNSLHNSTQASASLQSSSLPSSLRTSTPECQRRSVYPT